MESLIILIPLSLLAVLCAVWCFFRMSSSGQFDDDQGPAWSVILDDDNVGDDCVDDEWTDDAHTRITDKASINNT